MATMIASDCINCGACEPECPNNAISQGDPIFVIDPVLCTECVGFHDYEACAAVCPVDVCITDPNNIESEEVLIARARSLHPETNFGDSFESRFRKGEGKAGRSASERGGTNAGIAGAGQRRRCASLYRRGSRIRRSRRQLRRAAADRFMEHSHALLQVQPGA
jgi:NAD-dependent dihydropyrimidine dehydrogenase PreA subunit